MIALLASWHVIHCYTQDQLERGFKKAETENAICIKIECHHVASHIDPEDWISEHRIIYWLNDGIGNIYADDPSDHGFREKMDE